MTAATRKAFADERNRRPGPVELAARLERIKPAETPSAARALLRRAGIVDRSGKLTPAYR